MACGMAFSTAQICHNPRGDMATTTEMAKSPNPLRSRRTQRPVEDFPRRTSSKHDLRRRSPRPTMSSRRCRLDGRGGGGGRGGGPGRSGTLSQRTVLVARSFAENRAFGPAFAAVLCYA